MKRIVEKVILFYTKKEEPILASGRTLRQKFFNYINNFFYFCQLPNVIQFGECNFYVLDSI